jgi:hypothetical protein
VCPADKEKRTYKQLLVLASLQLALKGSPTAFKEIWDRVDGKILQPGKMELAGPGGKQIQIHVVYDDGPDTKD